MEEIISILKECDLCTNNNFFLYLKEKIEFINPALYEFAGCYEKDGQIYAKIPKISDFKMGSIAVHELGHLYDSYITCKIVENEDTALFWEFTYLYKKQQFELIKSRIDEIYRSPQSSKYFSLKKILKNKGSSTYLKQ